MPTKEFRFLCSGIAPTLYPADTVWGLLWYNEDEAIEIPKRYPFAGEWGEVISSCIPLREEYPMPYKLNLMWMSVVENKLYEIEAYFPVKHMEKIWESNDKSDSLFSHIVVGMAPCGCVSVWANGFNKSVLLLWVQASNVTITPHMQSFPPVANCLLNRNQFLTSSVRSNLEKNGLPSRDLFDNYMKQFAYRYQVMFGWWDEEEEIWSSDCKFSQNEKNGEEADSKANATPQYEFDYIEEALFDGTHDKLHDGGLMKYHEAGKPKKLAVKWHVKKKEWTAYFWFEDEEIRRMFDCFYGTHPDTKTDFMIRIDPEKNHYELALFRYGLREPQVIPEKTYQLLVFKNKFECFRSKNYAQERGAWIW